MEKICETVDYEAVKFTEQYFGFVTSGNVNLVKLAMLKGAAIALEASGHVINKEFEGLANAKK